MQTSYTVTDTNKNAFCQLPKQKRQSPQKNFFEIHSLEWIAKNKGLNDQRMLPTYEVFWFQTAKGTILIDSQLLHITNNTIYCFSPGQLLFLNLEEDIQGYKLSFSHDFLLKSPASSSIDSWVDTIVLYGKVVHMLADDEMQLNLLEILRKMQHEYTNYFLLRSEILSGLLSILMIYFSRKLQVEEKDMLYCREIELVHQFKSLLKQHFISKKMVADYASELCVTANYLNRTVKKRTGFTASYHIQQQIIQEAKKQAVHSNISMKEIAYYLGFENLAHFSKFFKNNSGINFSHFKKGSIAVS